MFNVLQARGVPSKFVMFPDEHHVSQRGAIAPRENRDTNMWQVGAQAGEFISLASGGAGLGQQVQRNLRTELRYLLSLSLSHFPDICILSLRMCYKFVKHVKLLEAFFRS